MWAAMICGGAAKPARFWPASHFQLMAPLSLTLPEEGFGKCHSPGADIAIQVEKCSMKPCTKSIESIKAMWKDYQGRRLQDCIYKQSRLHEEARILQQEIRRTEGQITSLQADISA